MRERASGFRSALWLCNASATEREFNVLRTALDLALTFSLALGVTFCPALRVAFRLALRVTFRLELSGALRLTDLFEVLRTARLLRL